MSFEAQFSVKELMKGLDAEIQKVETIIQNELIRVGLQFVRDARINADFTDRTGNLRSSIGFLILKNGENIFENFEQAGSGPDKATGVARAIQFAKMNLQDEINNGFILCVVAGMEYAVFVEAKGYDVLTSSSMKADDNLKNAMAELKQLAA